MSNPAKREKQFESAVQAYDPAFTTARLVPAFGYSNSARIVEGGLFLATSNFESYLKGIVEQAKEPQNSFIYLSVISLPPQDEVYIATIVRTKAESLNDTLRQMYLKRKEEIEAAPSPGKKNSNNVKFYLVSGARLFCSQEFPPSLVEDGHYTINLEQGAEIDNVLYSVWPPETNVRRSLLTHEMVGYLASLAGAEKIHELKIWESKNAISPDMQRMPHTLDLIGELVPRISAIGGYYSPEKITQYHTSLSFLAQKHFVILAGISGTGKTRLALTYARAVHGFSSMDEEDPLTIVCAVRPDWTDSAGLLGYADVLTGQYVVPPFLEAVLLATAYPTSPIFVVLDEMNLARVEYFLADVLSAMESAVPLALHQSAVPLPGSTGNDVPARLPLPPNLYITGTMNIDETTNSISDKVLDRAMLIDMSDVDMSGFLKQLSTEQSLQAAALYAEPLLCSIHALLTPHRLQFGYRTAEEVVRYLSFITTLGNVSLDAAFDDLMLQKIFTRLRGSDFQRAMLEGLRGILVKPPDENKFPRSVLLIDQLIQDLNEIGSFQTPR